VPVIITFKSIFCSKIIFNTYQLIVFLMSIVRLSAVAAR